MTFIIITNILYYITYAWQNQREKASVMKFNQHMVNFIMLINILYYDKN